MIAVDPATETLPPAAPETDLDFALLQKYDRPGPRYTSYPTAPQFTTAIAPADLLAALAADGRDSSRPVSLYFHLPFCESRCWFCGCTTVITRRTDLADAYLDTLERELACLADLVADGLLTPVPGGYDVTATGALPAHGVSPRLARGTDYPANACASSDRKSKRAGRPTIRETAGDRAKRMSPHRLQGSSGRARRQSCRATPHGSRSM